MTVQCWWLKIQCHEFLEHLKWNSDSVSFFFIKTKQISQLINPNIFRLSKLDFSNLWRLTTVLSTLSYCNSPVIYNFKPIQGFLDDSLKRPSLQKSRKRVANTIEQFMKLLESLDSLNLDTDNTGGRAKRKGLVDRINVSTWYM